MSNSFQLNQYSVLTAVSDRTIYIKIVDTHCYMCYEGNVDIKELRLNLELADVYTLINKCFTNEDDEYSVNIGINSGVMRLGFKALVGGFLRIQFEIVLREKLMSNDGQLTFNFTRLEQELAALNQTLVTKCNTLARENVVLLERLGQMPVPILLQWHGHIGNFIGENSYYSANVTNLELNGYYPSASRHDKIIFKNLVSFYQLKTLKITGQMSDSDFKLMQNNILEELWLDVCGSNNLTSLQGIQQRLPNLRTLTIHAAPALRDIPTVLRSAPHKIKKICIKACAAVNTVEMQTFCQTSGIALEIA